MIIFDLDGTLADCEHRRHLVDYTKVKTSCGSLAIRYHGPNEGQTDPSKWRLYHEETNETWKPNWQAFYEACDKDVPISSTINILKSKFNSWDTPQLHGWEIWSGRCSSVREKTLKWIKDYINCCFPDDRLKMRPIGDSTPDDQLKEKWLDEALSSGKKIDFVFDDRPKVIRMWRRRGIFVFNCCQHDEEF